MYPSFLNQMFPVELIRAISWTLLHSLWQGLILAVVAAIVIVMSRRLNPAIRYNLLLTVFGLQIVSSLVTFYIMVQSPAPSTGEVYPAIAGSIPIDTHYAAAQVTDSLTSRFMHMLDDYAPQVVGIWLFVMLLLTLKMLIGFVHLHQLKYRQVFQPGGRWTVQFGELRERLGIKPPVALLESARAKMPMIIGFFRPVVLVPLGLLNNLSPSQVEAILCHELAHIRRHDYLVNILQNIAETIFFFNPAIWWISSLLRDEREHCCDDIALNHGIEKRTLADALVAFQEYRFTQSGYALAFAGPKYRLLERVSRLFSNRNSTLTPFVQLVLVVCIVTAGITFTAFNNHSAAQSSYKVAKQSLLTDTIPDAKAMQRKLQEIDRKYVPLQEAVNEKIKKMKQDLNELENSGPAKTTAEQAQTDMKKAALMAKMDSMRMDVSGKKSAEVRNAMGYDDHPIAVAAPNEKGAGAAELKAKEDSKNLSNFEKSRRDEDAQDKRLEQSKTSAEDHLNFEKQREQRRKQEAEGDRFFSELINDIIKEKAAVQRQGITFMLSRDKLIVNEREQPADVQKRLAEKYLKNPNSVIVYRFHSEMIGWMDRNELQL